MLYVLGALAVWVLHGFTSTIWREFGSWCPHWAALIITRRSVWLPRGQRIGFVTESGDRMSAIPGDVSKLVFTFFALRVGSRPAVGRRMQLFLLIAFLIFAITVGIEVGHLWVVLPIVTIPIIGIGHAARLARTPTSSTPTTWAVPDRNMRWAVFAAA